MELDPAEGIDSECGGDSEDTAGVYTWKAITDDDIQDGVRIWRRIKAEIARRHERYEASIEGLLGLIETSAEGPTGASVP